MTQQTTPDAWLAGCRVPFHVGEAAQQIGLSWTADPIRQRPPRSVATTPTASGQRSRTSRVPGIQRR